MARREALNELSAFECRFVNELLTDPLGDETQAALRAGSSDPAQDAKRLMKDGRIRSVLSYARRNRNNRVGVDGDYLVKRWIQVIEADPRELVEHWLVPCRHCHGFEHRYQRTDGEYREAQEQWEAAVAVAQKKYEESPKATPFDEPFFDELGGPGYTINRQPMRGPDWVRWVQENARVSRTPVFAYEANAERSCPECHGHGIPQTIIHDTRFLSPGAALLFEGLKVDSHGGVEVKIRSRTESEMTLAKHLGMFVERKIVVVADANKLTRQELVDAIAAEEAEIAEIERRALPAPG